MKIPYFDSRDLDYNPLINSNLDFWQRSLSTLFTTVDGRVSDKHYAGATGPTSKSITVARSTIVPTQVPVHARYSNQLTNNTAVPSLAATDYLYPLLHPIEGNIWRPVANSGFTFGFWMFTTVAGTFPVAFRRNSLARSYVTTVTAAANVWQYHVVHVPLDTGGPAQVLDESRAMDVLVNGMGGSNFQAASLNTWLTGNFFTHASVTNWAATLGAVIRIAQMGIKRGFRSLEDMRDGYKPHGQNYNAELIACQRYFEKTYNIDVPPGTATVDGAIINRAAVSSALDVNAIYKVRKRAQPGNVIFYSIGGAANNFRNNNSGLDTPTSGTLQGSGDTQLAWRQTGGIIDQNEYIYHWTADAEM